MINVTIAEKGGGSRSEIFEKPEVTIGRIQGNDIVLAKGNVSKHHSRIVLKDGKFIIVDLKSTNGTYVNGKRISAPQVLKETDKIYIGDYILNVGAAEDAPMDEGYEDEAAAAGGYDEGYEDEAPPEEDYPEEEQYEEEEPAPPPRALASRPAPSR
ncbi:MAG: FHA domain-containing protein, partial [Myxococcales bacterium]